MSDQTELVAKELVARAALQLEVAASLAQMRGDNHLADQFKTTARQLGEYGPEEGGDGE